MTMGLKWVFESRPQWDPAKQRIVGGAPAGVFALDAPKPGKPIPGEWWRVEDGRDVVGYGWMDTTWEGAEILLAVDPSHQRHGVGSFILDRLEDEARARGVEYLFNVVRDTHPEREAVTRWLNAHGFEGTADGELRRRVSPRSDR
jgi:GNAT superfamily N-acetyltransferase